MHQRGRRAVGLVFVVAPLLALALITLLMSIPGGVGSLVPKPLPFAGILIMSEDLGPALILDKEGPGNAPGPALEGAWRRFRTNEGVVMVQLGKYADKTTAERAMIDVQQRYAWQPVDTNVPGAQVARTSTISTSTYALFAGVQREWLILVLAESPQNAEQNGALAFSRQLAKIR